MDAANLAEPVLDRPLAEGVSAQGSPPVSADAGDRVGRNHNSAPLRAEMEQFQSISLDVGSPSTSKAIRPQWQLPLWVILAVSSFVLGHILLRSALWRPRSSAAYRHQPRRCGQYRGDSQRVPVAQVVSNATLDRRFNQGADRDRLDPSRDGRCLDLSPSHQRPESA